MNKIFLGASPIDFTPAHYSGRVHELCHLCYLEAGCIRSTGIRTSVNLPAMASYLPWILWNRSWQNSDRLSPSFLFQPASHYVNLAPISIYTPDFELNWVLDHKVITRNTPMSNIVATNGMTARLPWQPAKLMPGKRINKSVWFCISLLLNLLWMDTGSVSGCTNRSISNLAFYCLPIGLSLRSFWQL